MRIAVDSYVFTRQKYGGVSRYLVRLGEELVKSGHAFGVFGGLHVNRHLLESRAPLSHARYIKEFPPYTRRAAHRVGDWIAGLQLARWKPDLIHESFCHARPVGPRNLPRVCTMHDLIHELFPDYWGKMDRTPEHRRKTLERADAIICVSESTKRDLLRLIDLPEEKVHVVHHGFDPHAGPPVLTAEETRLAEEATSVPFLLHVGTRHHYKNFNGLIEALARTPSLTDFGVVAFGGGPLTPGEREMISASGLAPGRVHQIGGSDALLRQLLRRATAFIYPSLYEGFGFPPLEAMAERCPVISSNSSSMPEVIGDAAEFFDPADVESISAAMTAVLTSPTRRSELTEKGTRRLKCFSWERCASETAAIYRSLI